MFRTLREHVFYHLRKASEARMNLAAYPGALQDDRTFWYDEARYHLHQARERRIRFYRRPAWAPECLLP